MDVSMEDPYLFLDADQMMQVLTNLEKNAIEAMPEGGELSIKLTEHNGDVEIEHN
jgi:signal transduction histidine kinase